MRANDTALLEQVAKNWLDERDHWAFTQLVREFDGKEMKQERIERYDPSKGFAQRWQLVSINGQPPTEKELSEWLGRKNKKKRRDRPGLGENFDFTKARIAEETPESIRYELPLRSSIDWLFPISKVELLITISKRGPALEQVQARISEPFRVALGLARILDIDLDVQMAPPPSSDPADAKPSGTAHAVVTKFGDRVEYYWSEFKRVEETSGKKP
ncbi:MAG: hypothetical protein ABIV50_01295 [Opitutus sp.]